MKQTLTDSPEKDKVIIAVGDFNIFLSITDGISREKVVRILKI